MPIREISPIRSESLREFISHRPGALIRYGIPVFFLVLISLAIGSYFIQFPDVVKASARINTLNAPKPVVVKNGGRLVKLFVTDNTNVQNGTLIGFIESIADPQEVLKLSALLDTLQLLTADNRTEEIPGLLEPERNQFKKLGELQPGHEAFIRGYLEFTEYLNSGFYVSKKKMLRKDIDNTLRMLSILNEQKTLQQQDLDLTTETYNVHDTLHDESLINDIEYRNLKSQLINKKMSIPQMNASIITNQTQQNTLNKEMLELENRIIQQKKVFTELLNTYRNSAEEWKQKFMLIAPVKGQIVFSGFVEENQQLKTGQLIGFITNETNSYYAEMLIPFTNSGKVIKGQDVLLKFPAWPSQEFGSVKGKIDYIKAIPADSGYLAKVILPFGLTTNYKKELLFSEGMIANAEIITADKRLSDRFIEQIRSLIQ
jgi:HlyD family secretion protein